MNATHAGSPSARFAAFGWMLSFAILAVSGLGCSEDATAPERQALFSIVPTDGATGVRLDASVVMQFAGSVDREVVERSFHLLSEASMNDSLCSTDPSAVGDMTEMMGSGAMMEYMIEAHSVSGGFQWNGDGECVFTPDAPMTSSTRYMVHLEREMMEMTGGMPMAGHGTGMDGDGTLHFTTLDPGSHESHH